MVFRNDLTEVTRMAGGARTRGMRTACKLWCLYTYLVYGFQRNDLTEATRMAGGARTPVKTIFRLWCLYS